MTAGSVDPAKVDHVVEELKRLKKSNKAMLRTHGSDLVASQNFC